MSPLGARSARKRPSVRRRKVLPRELNVGEAGLLKVIGQPWGHLPVGQIAVPFIGNPLPRACVNFIDRNGGIQRIPLAAALHGVGGGLAKCR